MDMEVQEQPWQEEEVEEGAALLGRQSRQHHNNISNNGAEEITEENGAEEKTEDDGAEEKTEENDRNKSVYFETHQGYGSAHQVSGIKYNATDSSSVSESNSTDEELNLKTNKFEIPSTETNNGNGKHLENESLSGLSPVTVQKLHDKNIKNLEDLQNTAQGDAEVDLIEEIDNEFTDLDVERVLQKQNTHDLYCPNCNSCITTRVVLRRRRRRVRNIRYKTKPGNNLETPTELDASLAYPPNYQGSDKHNVSPNVTRRTPPANDHNNIGQRNISPNGTPTPPAIDHNNNTQNGTPTPPAVDRNTEIFRCLSCFSLFVPTGNGCKLFQCFGGGSDESVIIQDVQTRPAPTKNWLSKIFSSGDDVIIDVEPQPDQTHPAQTNPLETHPVQTKPVPTHPVQTKPHHMQPGLTQPGQMQPGQMQTLPAQTQPGQIQPGQMQTLPGQTQSGQTQSGHMQPVRTVESSNWDILKSIVYGGLVESITSLGVVSSAAGAGATTLNILALGLASVIGGLFIIADNLKELKNDHSEETSNQINVQEGRYQRLLGWEQNFSRHAVVVILSFLIFGLLPPVIYGFSFRKSDDRDLKIAAVAGSSLVCIVLLAVAKGHVQKPPRSYFRTVSYYVSLGVAASGISYVVGDLFEKLMEKLGLFVSSKEVVIPFLETDLMNTTMKPAWSSF
ncbi:hypothetical protein Ddye_028580 [Dipteronia dyeriana]|uniref:Membrane protein of ER body-like protein n=1 Tax=Dipteronia dyeriana TaxID=168575 RepID=A0AAD9TDZ8_9ROSI|nr:hypothetical protein Ddye_028580 [Dipteronia dyeriana]